jgi:hypothetical protein
MATEKANGGADFVPRVLYSYGSSQHTQHTPIGPGKPVFYATASGTLVTQHVGRSTRRLYHRYISPAWSPYRCDILRVHPWPQPVPLEHQAKHVVPAAPRFRRRFQMFTVGGSAEEDLYTVPTCKPHLVCCVGTLDVKRSTHRTGGHNSPSACCRWYVAECTSVRRSESELIHRVTMRIIWTYLIHTNYVTIFMLASVSETVVFKLKPETRWFVHLKGYRIYIKKIKLVLSFLHL